MDKIFVDEALGEYREKTGDMRPWELLPVEIISQILREAQKVKDSRLKRKTQPATADGCAGS